MSKKPLATIVALSEAQFLRYLEDRNLPVRCYVQLGIPGIPTAPFWSYHRVTSEQTLSDTTALLIHMFCPTSSQDTKIDIDNRIRKIISGICDVGRVINILTAAEKYGSKVSDGGDPPDPPRS